MNHLRNVEQGVCGQAKRVSVDEKYAAHIGIAPGGLCEVIEGFTEYF